MSGKSEDYGGCRCQAYLMTGDATTADPVCDKSPFHSVVTDTIERVKKISAETTVRLYRCFSAMTKTRGFWPATPDRRWHDCRLQFERRD